MTMLPKGYPYWSNINLEKKMQKKAKRCRRCREMNNGWCNKYKKWCSSCHMCKIRNPVSSNKV